MIDHHLTWKIRLDLINPFFLISTFQISNRSKKSIGTLILISSLQILLYSTYSCTSLSWAHAFGVLILRWWRYDCILKWENIILGNKMMFKQDLEPSNDNYKIFIFKKIIYLIFVNNWFYNFQPFTFWKKLIGIIVFLISN
jgi:hypothetical protein